MSEWDGIEGFEGWQAKLDLMIEEAKETASKGVEARIKLNDRFAAFIMESRPNTPRILDLDKIAERTSDAMMAATLDERLSSLSSRTIELAVLTKKFQAEMEANKESARSIRLENITGVVDALTESAAALGKLKEVAKDATDEQLQSSIGGAIRSVTKLVNKFRKEKMALESSSG